jgi:DNA invertase Pin-like site-specific DNA recombinase
LERQTADKETMARIADFCRLFGFAQSKRIRVDDGISAWKGLNATPEHELGQFIREANQGLILPGDCLLIENYDRLSRQDPWASVSLVNDLRQLGIHVGRLDTMKILRCDSTDVGDFFEAVGEFYRGHSESNAKSYRNSSAWRRKREAAREGKGIITRRLPGWVREENGQLVLIEERAAVIRRIFDLAGAGCGGRAIRRRFLEEKVPPFGERHVRDNRRRSAFSGHWTVSYIQSILSDRRALGEHQPRDSEGNPSGSPIPDYYPRAVSDEAWSLARAGARERRVRGGRVTADVNVFQGLWKDARSGDGYMVRKEMGKGKPYYSMHSQAPRRSGGHAFSFLLEPFERAVLTALREIDPREILHGDRGPDETLALGKQLSAVESELAEATADMDANGFSPTIAKRVRSLEDRQRATVAALAAAREKNAHPLSETWGQAQTLIGALATAPDRRDARLRLRSAIRRICSSIWLLVVPRARNRLCAVQIWFAGEERHRDYLILRRPPHGSRWGTTKGLTCFWSLADVIKPGELDLRKREDAAALERALLAVDLEKLTADASRER